MVRGGSWNNSARNCRAAYRNRNRPENRNRNQGFRVCLFPGTTADRSGGRRRTARVPVSEWSLTKRDKTWISPRRASISVWALARKKTEKTFAGAPCLMKNATALNPNPPTAVTLELPEGVELEFRWIPPGEFLMGSRGEYSDEEPVHLVKITRGFYLGRYPVTQGQFAAWKKSHENYFPGDLRRPVEQVTWDEAEEYCAWLNDRSQVTWPPGLNEFAARLPTEAQWEYACRAGIETEFYTGDGESALSAAGWYDGNSNSTTQPVGCKEPNAYGLYDMHGNVWEWCADVYYADAYKARVDGVRDPDDSQKMDSGGVRRVVRGGSWDYSAGYCRAAYRVRVRPGYRLGDRGFRVCLFPGPCRATRPNREAAEPVPGDGARR